MNPLHPYFSQNPLDRLDQVRRDEKEVIKLMNSKNARFLLFNGSHIIVDEKNRECFFEKDILSEYNIAQNEVVLLGSFENITYFAVTLKDGLKNNLLEIALREFVGLDYISENQYGILAQASSVLQWHNSHTFCSSCGEVTKMIHAGWRRDCQSCKKEHFPRVDSVVIMLVTFGDYCLVGRGAHFREGVYSCLAGYVESGESLENAAKRELFEESGVEGYDVEYIMSQPWPFPSTLMVGIQMKARSQTLILDTHEIEDAKWIHKDDIKAVLNNESGYDFKLPSSIAIARNLLEVWINQ